MDPRELREATRAEHEAMESLMPLTAPGLTVETYVGVLQVLYPVLESWEVWSDAFAAGKLREMLRDRRRAHLLLADLAAFGVQPVSPWGPIVPWEAVAIGDSSESVEALRRNFQARLLGMIYVMEGSTLGGRFLARHVESVLGLAEGQGYSYFQGHGEDTGRMWREVLDQLSAVPEKDAPLTIGAARRTFRAFGEALRAGLPATQTVHG